MKYNQFSCPVCSHKLDNQVDFGRHLKSHSDVDVGGRVMELLYTQHKYAEILLALDILEKRGGQYR